MDQPPRTALDRSPAGALIRAWFGARSINRAMSIGAAAVLGWPLLVGAGSAAAKPASLRGGRQPLARASVIGGHVAEPGSLPFMAFIFIQAEGQS